MTRNCPHCGTSFESNLYGRPRRYCTPECSQVARDANSTATARAKRAAAKPKCAHPDCGSPLPTRQKRFCSALCRNDWQVRTASPYGFGDRCAVWFKPCPDCGNLVTLQIKGPAKRCTTCKRAAEVARSRKKNHTRRVRAGGAPKVTVVELAQMHGPRCHLCRGKVDMSLSGLHPKGPTVDHLIPVSQGGTNDTLNLALAHRECNTRRGNRGSAQLRLVA